MGRRLGRLVTLAVPPAALDRVLFSEYGQLKRFFYLFMFRDPSGFAEALVAADGMTFLDRLWRGAVIATGTSHGSHTKDDYVTARRAVWGKSPTGRRAVATFRAGRAIPSVISRRHPLVGAAGDARRQSPDPRRSP